MARHRGDPQRGRHQYRLLAGDAQRRAGEATGGDGCAPLQPQPGDGPLVLSPRRHHHTWEERWNTLSMVREAAWRCVAAHPRHGQTLQQRAEFAAELAALGPDEVPLNFLNPRRHPFADLEVMRPAKRSRRWPPFGWHYRAPCSDSRAAVRSRWGTSVPTWHARRHQRSDRRNYLTTLGGRPRPTGTARRSADADQGAQRKPVDTGRRWFAICPLRSARELRRLHRGPAGTSVSRPPPVGVEPPRFCAECGRGWLSRCGRWLVGKCSGTAGWTPPTWKRGDERAPFG
ncbi:putative biotin synthase [Mycobacterium xenopi 4042]|uniref:Putative biotin synthase n=1 Tax=Mycobacterium xenopi 4042 TaxID=1299334 RepID=X8BDB8_MYCXE|nr:putative biotin synthase [Mycobacterium xenopi 4042]